MLKLASLAHALWAALALSAAATAQQVDLYGIDQDGQGKLHLIRIALAGTANVTHLGEIQYAGGALPLTAVEGASFDYLGTLWFTGDIGGGSQDYLYKIESPSSSTWAEAVGTPLQLGPHEIGDVGGMAPFDGNRLVITDGPDGGATYTFDPRNLSLFTYYGGPISGDATAIARFPNAGTLAYEIEKGNTLFTVDIAVGPGSRQQVGVIQTASGTSYGEVQGLTEGPDSYLYGFDRNSSCFLRINPSDARVVAVWPSSSTINHMFSLCARQTWLRIDQEPVSIAACPGTSASFSVTASGTGSISYQWFKGVDPIIGATASTLVFASVQPSDQGTYSVRVSNPDESLTSAVASLVVYAPPTLSGPMDAAVCAGQSAVLSIEVTSAGSSFGFQWHKNGVPVSSGGNLSITMPTPTSSVLALNPTSVVDQASYSVAVTDLSLPCNATATGAAALEVHALPTDPVAPSASPAQICPGFTSALQASVGAGLQVHWYAGGCGAGPYLATNVVAPTTTTTYFAKAYDPVTGCESNGCASIQVDVGPGPAAPPISTDDADNTLCVGESIELSVPAQPGIAHDWFGGACGGAPLFTGDIYALVPAATTTYYVRSRDAAGCFSAVCSSVEVTVLGLPSIAVTPNYVEYCDGDTIVLQSVGATGTYRWFKDGALLPGETLASLTLSAATAATEGAYRVQVTDACGFVATSANAGLVSAAPRITGASSSAVSTRGGTVTFFGLFLDPGTAVEVLTPQGEVIPLSVTFTPGHDQVTLTLDAIPPGCECAQQPSIPAIVRLDNGCGRRRLEDFAFSLRFDVHRQAISSTSNLQAMIDAALPGTCLVLTAASTHVVNFDGPVSIANKTRLTLTGNTTAPGRRVIRGDWAPPAGPPPPDPALVLDNVGPDVCVSHLSFRLGNSGLEARNGAAPIVKSCLMDDNHADDSHGGGITVSGGSMPLIVKCVIAANVGAGGGLRIDASSAIFLDGLVINNVTREHGSGLFLVDADPNCVIADNIIRGNRGALLGGGIYLTNPSTPGGELLLRNEIRDNVSSGSGGGIYVEETALPRIIQNAIRGNQAMGTEAYGGGIGVAAYNMNPILILENEVFGNEAQVGGGMCFLNKNAATVARNLVYCNRARQNADPEADPMPAAYAGGIAVTDNDVLLYHNTIALNTGFAAGESIDSPSGDTRPLASPDDQGGGINLDYPGALTESLDNILFANTGYEYFQSHFHPFVTLDYNLLFDPADMLRLYSPEATPGPNGLELDPMFMEVPSCTPASAWTAFALEPGSPGEGAASDATDIGAVIAQGFVPGSYLEPTPGDCNANGVPDWADILSARSADGNWNGTPDECESLLTADVTNLSVSAGGTQTLTLDAGSVLAGELCVVLGSFSGTSPGTSWMGISIPLNPDPYFASTRSRPYQQSCLSFPLRLDDLGRALVRFTLPPGGDAALVGVEFNHVLVVLRPRSGVGGGKPVMSANLFPAPRRAPRFVSNPVAVTLVP